MLSDCLETHRCVLLRMSVHKIRNEQVTFKTVHKLQGCSLQSHVWSLTSSFCKEDKLSVPMYSRLLHTDLLQPTKWLKEKSKSVHFKHLTSIKLNGSSRALHVFGHCNWAWPHMMVRFLHWDDMVSEWQVYLCIQLRMLKLALDWGQRQVRFWERSHGPWCGVLLRAMLKEKKNLIKCVQKAEIFFFLVCCNLENLV